MASPVIPNCIQIRLLWTVDANLAINVLNTSHAGTVPVNQALANSLGASIKTAFTNNLALHYRSSAALQRIGVRDMSAPNQPEFLDTNPGVGGTGVGDSLPANVAMCITHRTAKSGKSFRGRTYLPAMIETVNGPGGTADPAAATAALAFFTAVGAAFVSAGLKFAIASRAADRETLTRTTFFDDGSQQVDVLSETKRKDASLTDVTSSSSRTGQWESQRRRGNGRGLPPALLTSVAETVYAQ